MIALPPQPDLDLASLVRTIPDFPRPGIRFRDITTLIGDAAGYSESVRRLSARAAAYRPDLIVAVEARGLLFGAAMATAMGLDRKSTRLNSSHYCAHRMPSSA